MSIRVYDPTAEEAAATGVAAARLVSLEGCTIGLLDNSKIRVRELLDHMEALLREQYGVAEVRRVRKPDASRPAPPPLLIALQGCDAVIAAVGD